MRAFRPGGRANGGRFDLHIAALAEGRKCAVQRLLSGRRG
jgi:hypothetical protein